jgi:hypothetical protein
VAQDTLETLSSAKRIEYLTAAIATAQDVYDNKDATLAELLKADAALKEAIVYIPEEGLKGDVNGDGLVNSSDVVRLYEYMAGQTEGVSESAADVNGDGTVNSSDIVRIYEIMAGN